MKRWSFAAAMLALLSVSPRSEAVPEGARRAVVAQRSAQSRACQECGTERCGPPTQQCVQECERPTIPPRPEERIEQCRLVCQDRFVACLATACQACRGTIQATPGVRPFAPRIGAGGAPGEGGEAAPGAPGAPAGRPRVVTLRRGR